MHKSLVNVKRKVVLFTASGAMLVGAAMEEGI